MKHKVKHLRFIADNARKGHACSVWPNLLTQISANADSVTHEA